MSTGTAEVQQCAELEAYIEKVARAEIARREVEAKQEAAVRAEVERSAKPKEVKERVEREAKERAYHEAREEMEREPEENAEREKEKPEKEERIEGATEEKAGREMKEMQEETKKTPASQIPSSLGSVVGKNDRSREASGRSQEKQKNEWTGAWDLGFTEKESISGIPPTYTPSITGGLVGSSAGQKGSPGGAGELEAPTPRLKKKKKKAGPANVGIPAKKAGVCKLDILEDLNTNNTSARTVVSSRLENERWTDAEQGPSPTEPTPPALALEPVPEASFNISEFKTPKDAQGKTFTTLEPWPAPPLIPARQSPVPTFAPLPAKAEPEKPLSLWERKKLKQTSPPAPAYNLFGGGDGTDVVGSFWTSRVRTRNLSQDKKDCIGANLDESR